MMDSSWHEDDAPPQHMYKSALEALLLEGVRIDLRKNVRNNVTYAQFQKLD